MIRRQAFTLMEMLVVISIITLLISILQPSLRQAKYRARTLECQANVYSQWLAQTMLADANFSRFWRHNDYSADYVRSGGASDSLWYAIKNGRYLSDYSITICPVIKAQPGATIAPSGYRTYLDHAWNGSTYAGFDSDQPQILTTYLWLANFQPGDGVIPNGAPTIYQTVDGAVEPTWPVNIGQATSNRAVIAHRISGGPGYPCHDLGHLGDGLSTLESNLLRLTPEQTVAFGDGHVIARPRDQIKRRTLIPSGGIGYYYY